MIGLPPRNSVWPPFQSSVVSPFFARMPDSNSPLLNASQRRVVAFALTLLAFLGSWALIISAFYVFGRLIGVFSSVLWPLAVAGVLALLLRPLVEILEVRYKVRRTGAVLLLYALFVLLVTGLLVVIVP